MNKKNSLRLFAGATLLLASGGNAFAQQADAEPLVQLTTAQTTHFQQALDALAGQGHVAIVAEGIPLHTTLTRKKAPDLAANTPLGVAVTQVAAAYDYDVMRKGAVFAFRKRYSDPHDLPSVTLEECQLDIADAIRIMTPFSPNFQHTLRVDIAHNLSTDFAATLSPQQEQAMANKTLRVADLTADQQGIVKQLFSFEYVQTHLRKAKLTLEDFEQLPKSTLTTTNERGESDLYLETTHLFDDDPALPVRGQMALYRGNVFDPNVSVPLVLPDAPKPKPGAVSEPSGSTLGQVVSRLNAAEKLPMAVETPLQNKLVMVAGLENARASSVISAMAAVYGLRIGVADNGQPKLARQGMLMPNAVQELAPALWNSLPDSYLRAVHYEEVFPASSVAPALANLSNPASMKQLFEQQNQRIHRPSAVRELPNQLRQEAVHRMIVLLQPQLRTLKSGERIPVASLTAPVRSVLAIALMANVVSEFANAYSDQYNLPVTRCLKMFDQVIVYGKSYPDPNPMRKGQTAHSLFLEGRDPETNQIVGMGGVGFE